jgi:hypothetical protein
MWKKSSKKRKVTTPDAEKSRRITKRPKEEDQPDETRKTRPQS